MRLIDQEVLPRVSDGMDWGNKRRVLIRSPKGLLFIRAGHQQAHGAYGFGSYYAPTQLILMERRLGVGRDGIGRWLSEGRISRNVILQHEPLITKVFGTDAWIGLVNTRKTLVID